MRVVHEYHYDSDAKGKQRRARKEVYNDHSS